MKKRMKIVTGVCIAAVLVSGFLLIKYEFRSNQTKQRFDIQKNSDWEDELQRFVQISKDIIETARETEAEVPDEPEEEAYAAPPALLSLMEENKDVIGWLTVAGTNIDYPLMQKIEDNEYFLHRDIDGNESYPGSIYMDSNHRLDLKGLHILYGHNMKNGTMFRDVVKFMDSDYFNSHQDIKIYTAEKEFVLEPIFCYAARADGSYRSMIYEQEELESFLLKKTGKELEADNVFVLITCSYGSEDERTYLIVREIEAE